jgi:hypothetical protein
LEADIPASLNWAWRCAAASLLRSPICEFGFIAARARSTTYAATAQITVPQFSE